MTANDGAAQRRRTWIAAVDANDVETYASIVTDDVVWLPPFGDPLQGRASFRRWIEPVMGEYSYTLQLEATTSGEAGDWAYELGAFRSIMEPRDGGEIQEHRGYYFVLWRNETDGAWRIERYVDLATAEGHHLSPG